MDRPSQEPSPEYEMLQNVPTTSDNYMPYYDGPYEGGHQQQPLPPPPQQQLPPQQHQQQQQQQQLPPQQQGQGYGYTMSGKPEKPSGYREMPMEEINDEEEEEQEFRQDQNPRYTPPIMKPKKLGVLLDQERFLPIANVARIMKTRCENGTKISKDAKECVQECLSEFISFLTAEAAEYCHQTKRKTITADDLLTALEAMGFDNYAEPMRITLAKYRQANKITGPIHREHENYQRPQQFQNDPPFRPLFFETENGSRCTETRYFNVDNGSVTNDAQLSTEWQEQTQESAPQNPPPQATIIPKGSTSQYQAPPPTSQPTTSQQPTIVQPLVTQPTIAQPPIAEPGTLPITALEQQTQMQIYVDASTKQHYAAMDTENGVQLYPIQITSNAPITLTSLQSVNNSNPSTSTQGGPTYMYLPDGDVSTDKPNDHPPNTQY